MVKSIIFKAGLLPLVLPVLLIQLYLYPASEDITRRSKVRNPVLITAEIIEKNTSWGYQDGGAREGIFSLPEYGIENLRIVKKHGSFLKHLIIKLLDEYFVSTDAYSRSHIGDLLAPSDQKHDYYYIYVEGSDGFIWEDPMITYRLSEFSAFVLHFAKAGFRVGDDVCDCDDGRVSQNIIFQGETRISQEDMAILQNEAETYGRTIWDLSKEWVRIDFEGRSCPNSYVVFEEYLQRHRDSLQEHLGWKFRLLELAFLKATVGPILSSREDLQPAEQKEFNRLLARYQREIL